MESRIRSDSNEIPMVIDHQDPDIDEETEYNAIDPDEEELEGSEEPIDEELDGYDDESSTVHQKSSGELNPRHLMRLLRT